MAAGKDGGKGPPSHTRAKSAIPCNGTGGGGREYRITFQTFSLTGTTQDFLTFRPIHLF